MKLSTLILHVAEGDNFQRKNEIIHFRRSLDRVKFGLILRARKHDLRRLSTIRRLQFSTISPVQFSNPSAKGLRPGLTTETDCAVLLPICDSEMIWELMITEGNVEGIEAEPFLTCILLIKGK